MVVRKPGEYICRAASVQTNYKEHGEICHPLILADPIDKPW